MTNAIMAICVGGGLMAMPQLPVIQVYDIKGNTDAQIVRVCVKHQCSSTLVKKPIDKVYDAKDVNLYMP